MRFILSLLTVCVASLMTAGTAAHAESFTFTAIAALFNGAGTLTVIADPALSGAFEVTGITGTINGTAITGLLPCATYDPNNPCLSSGNEFSYDNLLYPGGIASGVQDLDLDGIGFAIGTSGLEGDFAGFGTHQDEFINNGVHDNGQVVAFSIAPIPEPGTFPLLGTGLLGVAAVFRRRIGG